MRFVKTDGGREAAGHTAELYDCACRAITIATERPYQEIWDAFKELMEAQGANRSKSGVKDFVINQVMERLGWSYVQNARRRLCEADLPVGRIVVRIQRHCVAVIDWVIHDESDCSFNQWGKPHYVHGYYKKGLSIDERVISSERKKVLDAVTKILALADSTNHKAEAETAKAKAAELIAKYDIALAEAKDFEEFKTVTEFRIGDMPSYEFHLLWALGEFCGVLVLSAPRASSGSDYLICGKPRDLADFRYLRESVSAQMDRGWIACLSEGRESRRKMVNWKYAFADGVTVKVRTLLRASAAQQRALRQDLTIVPRHKQAFAEYEALFGKLGSGGGCYSGERNADGFAAGKNVSLSKGVCSGGPVLRIAHHK